MIKCNVTVCGTVSRQAQMRANKECFIFTIVTKVLDLIKRRVLRWQNGVVK